jgi:hypothetical protein
MARYAPPYRRHRYVRHKAKRYRRSVVLAERDHAASASRTQAIPADIDHQSPE